VLDDLLNFINIPRAFSCCILPLYIEFRLAHHHIVESNFASHATSVAVEIEFRDGCIFRGQSLSNSKNLYKHDNDDDDESSDTRACVRACVCQNILLQCGFHICAIATSEASCCPRALCQEQWHLRLKYCYCSISMFRACSNSRRLVKHPNDPSTIQSPTTRRPR
jgi:hypothetical protein